VWDSAVIDTIDQGTPCWTDDDCKKLDPANPQCGYALFDLDKRAGTDGIIKLESRITSGSAREERGVCKAADDKPGTVPCGKAKACANNADCSGFTLQAQGVR
jgi:hypothetical protein